MKRGQEWSKEQIDYLYEHYPSERAVDVGAAINKSKSSVQHKANRLGISKDAEGFFEIRSKAKSGENSANFKGYRRRTSRGYITRFVPDHPSANKDGLVMEHRLVMEEHLGFVLPKGFAVHHINGIKDDNRIENLAVMTNSAHSIYHNMTDKKQKRGRESKLYKEVDAQKVNDLRANGYSRRRICEELGISLYKYYKTLRGE